MGFKWNFVIRIIETKHDSIGSMDSYEWTTRTQYVLQEEGEILFLLQPCDNCEDLYISHFIKLFRFLLFSYYRFSCRHLLLIPTIVNDVTMLSIQFVKRKVYA